MSASGPVTVSPLQWVPKKRLSRGNEEGEYEEHLRFKADRFGIFSLQSEISNKDIINI